MESAIDTAPEFVFLVDDEPDLQKLFVFNFENEGFRATAVGTAKEALAALAQERPSLFVLDVMLPDLSGIELCRRIRATEEVSDVPILMLTARGDEFDRILGFEAGADDYVVKPFSVRELLLRVRALLRRSREHSVKLKIDPGSAGRAERLVQGALTVDLVEHKASLAEHDLALRPLEFRLLRCLLERKGQTVTRKQLLEDVWGIVGSTQTRTVDTHVRRLRDKLGDAGEPIETVHGIGYRWKVE